MPEKELGRAEMIRAAGTDYSELEEAGTFLVVTEAACKYYRSCRFGDLVNLKVSLEKNKGTRIWHSYQLFKDEILLAEGNTTVCSVNSNGKPQRLPEWLQVKL